MTFDFAFAGFGLFAVFGVCGFLSSFAFACMEELKKAAIASVIMAISVAMACGLGGAMWL